MKIPIVGSPVAWLAAACLCISFTGFAAEETPAKARPGRSAASRGRAAKAESRRSEPAPTFANVSYGPDASNKIDLWKANRPRRPRWWSSSMAAASGAGQVLARPGASEGVPGLAAFLTPRSTTGFRASRPIRRRCTTAHERSSLSASRPPSGTSTRDASPAPAVRRRRGFRCGLRSTTIWPTPRALTRWPASQPV